MKHSIKEELKMMSKKVKGMEVSHSENHIKEVSTIKL